MACQLSFFIFLNIYVQSKKVTLHPAQQRFTRLLNIILLIIIAVLLTISLLLDNQIFNQETALTIVMTFLFVIILLFLLAYNKIIAILEENMQNQLQLQKAALEEDYNIHIEQNLKRIQTLRHDYKNQLIALQYFVTNGQYDQFQAHMDELHVELSKSSLITTPSIALSALLNVKEEICHNNEIKFTFEQEFHTLKCSDTVFISIISNILDNAITAARKLEKGTGVISLMLFQKDSYLFLECENNHCEHLQKSGDLYVTTKEDTLFHGYGLSSIKKSVEHLRGEMTITATEHTFRISIRIPNY
jgi:sensor histidine kinase regulating citrate/malate metabolism